MTDSIDLGAVIFGVFFGCIVLCVLCLVILKGIECSDNSKPLIIKRGRVLEKKISEGKIEWYVVEMEDGERLQLRNFNANKMIIQTGDYGRISYKGKTITSFNRI